jgi:hypothetical protein
MAPLGPEYAQLLEADAKNLERAKPRAGAEAAFFSSVTGKALDNLSFRPSYWVDNLTSPVRFGAGSLRPVEIGPRRRGVLGDRPALAASRPFAPDLRCSVPALQVRPRVHSWAGHHGQFPLCSGQLVPKRSEAALRTPVSIRKGDFRVADVPVGP